LMKKKTAVPHTSRMVSYSQQYFDAFHKYGITKWIRQIRYVVDYEYRSFKCCLKKRKKTRLVD
jgi:hypothetical protein